MLNRDALLGLLDGLLVDCDQGGLPEAVLDTLTPPIRDEVLFWVSVRLGQFWLPPERFHERAAQVLGREVSVTELGAQPLWLELMDRVPAWMPSGHVP